MAKLYPSNAIASFAFPRFSTIVVSLEVPKTTRVGVPWLTVASGLSWFALACSDAAESADGESMVPTATSSVDAPATTAEVAGTSPGAGGAGPSATASQGGTGGVPVAQAGGSGGVAPSSGGAGGQGGVPNAPVPAYLKASNIDEGDLFGVAIALSRDGNTLAVAANREASVATGVDGAQEDNTLADSGAVYVFVRSEGAWQQQAYLKASNSGTGDAFGSSLAISADGNTVAVGAPYEMSAAVGIDGDQSDDSAIDAGAVYVFARSGNTWAEQAYVKASNTDEYDVFGFSLALSADGNLLAVGADGEDGGTTGVDGDQSDRSAFEAGAVYLLARNAGTWEHAAYLKASNTDPSDHFGGAVALSLDGTTLAVGAAFEDGGGVGIDGEQADNSVTSAGAVYLFSYDGTAWAQQAYIKPAQNDGYGYDNFGSSISLSEDGSVLVVGAAGDNSAATGIDGDPTDTSMPYAGAAYVFGRDASTWSQHAYIKAGNPGRGDEFGHHVALATDGRTLAVGAALESSAGVNSSADPVDNSAPEAGAVYLFGTEGTSWVQLAYLKAPNTGIGDRFGWSVALSSDAGLLGVGANREAGGVTGVDAAEADDSAPRAGAAYVFDWAALVP